MTQLPGLENAELDDFFGSVVVSQGRRFASLAWLKRLKIAANRPQDRIDLEKLPEPLSRCTTQWRMRSAVAPVDTPNIQSGSSSSPSSSSTAESSKTVVLGIRNVLPLARGPVPVGSMPWQLSRPVPGISVC